MTTDGIITFNQFRKPPPAKTCFECGKTFPGGSQFTRCRNCRRREIAAKDRAKGTCSQLNCDNPVKYPGMCSSCAHAKRHGKEIQKALKRQRPLMTAWNRHIAKTRPAGPARWGRSP